MIDYLSDIKTATPGLSRPCGRNRDTRRLQLIIDLQEGNHGKPAHSAMLIKHKKADHLMQTTNQAAADKLALLALGSGSKVVANAESLDLENSQVVEINGGP